MWIIFLNKSLIHGYQKYVLFYFEICLICFLIVLVFVVGNLLKAWINEGWSISSPRLWRHPSPHLVIPKRDVHSSCVPPVPPSSKEPVDSAEEVCIHVSGNLHPHFKMGKCPFVFNLYTVYSQHFGFWSAFLSLCGCCCCCGLSVVGWTS